MTEAGLTGPAFCRALADAADKWLASLLPAPDVALVAVGGYGRRALCPGSDLDVMLLHRGRRDVQELASRVWYPVWDSGVRLDHSVRTVKDALAVASDDLKAATGLLDARLVAGDAALAEELRTRARAQWRGRAGAWLAALERSVEERHAAYGDVAFLLEPEIKEGRGGLRDVAALRAVALATDAVADELPKAVADAEALLLSVRVELHRRAGKAMDRLLLQEQDAVAAALGYADADLLMCDVAAAARAIAWESDDRWHRVTARPSRRPRPAPVGPGLVLVDGELELAADADVAGDPTLGWRAAAAWVETGARLSRRALERLGAEAPPAPDPWPPVMRDALLTVLGAGHAAVAVLEALDQMSLVVRSVPEWEAVRNRPQRNAYHRFTVDRHLSEAAAEAAAFTRQVARPDLLLVGAWLHDIGKGWPGRDHTEVGIEVVGRVGARLGFPPGDVATLQALVRHHLLLADVATRRDLDDPATVEAVAGAVGDLATLELLAALTEADGLATGPAAWGPWKAGLVADLVARTAQRLAGGRAPDGPSLDVASYAARLGDERMTVSVEGHELTVVARDRPGLFSRVAGALALHGLDVRAAQAASSDDGVAVELFSVEPATGREPDWSRVVEDVRRALTGRLSLEARLADRARDYASRTRVAAARPAEPRVLFDNDASATATVVEVRAPDGIGVLYRITRALADCDLDVRSAKVSTLGHEVVDAFYVRDAAGSKVTDPEHLCEVERAVLAELSRMG